MLERFDRRPPGYCSQNVLVGTMGVGSETPIDNGGLIDAMFRQDVYILTQIDLGHLGARS